MRCASVAVRFSKLFFVCLRFPATRTMPAIIARRAPPPNPTPSPIASALLLLPSELVFAACVLCVTCELGVVVNTGAAAFGVEKLLNAGTLVLVVIFTQAGVVVADPVSEILAYDKDVELDACDASAIAANLLASMAET